MDELINTSFYWSFVCAVAMIDADCCIEYFSAAYKNM
jgi:hypothetical protein